MFFKIVRSSFDFALRGTLKHVLKRSRFESFESSRVYVFARYLKTRRTDTCPDWQIKIAIFLGIRHLERSWKPRNRPRCFGAFSQWENVCDSKLLQNIFILKVLTFFNDQSEKTGNVTWESGRELGADFAPIFEESVPIFWGWFLTEVSFENKNLNF